MSAHTCTTLTPGCYRCDLNRDELDHIAREVNAEAQDAWLAYRDGPMKRWPKRQLRRREFVAGYLIANGIEASAVTRAHLALAALYLAIVAVVFLLPVVGAR